LPQTVGTTSQREVLLGAAARFTPETLAKLETAVEDADRTCQLRWIAGIHQPASAPMLHRRRDRAHAGGQHGPPARHCLEQDVRQSVPVAGAIFNPWHNP